MWSLQATQISPYHNILDMVMVASRWTQKHLEHVTIGVYLRVHELDLVVYCMQAKVTPAEIVQYLDSSTAPSPRKGRFEGTRPT